MVEELKQCLVNFTTKVASILTNDKDLVKYHGQMDPATQESSQEDNCMDMEITHGLMARIIEANGKMGYATVLELLPGHQEQNMRATISKIRKMDLVL